MQRREFIKLLGGAAVAWPLAAQTQQPATPVIGYLSGRSPAESAHIVNPKDPSIEMDLKGAKTAADTFGQKLVVVGASTESDIDAAFTSFVRQKVAALFVDVDPFFAGQRAKIVALAARHALPLVSQLREFADAGGLMTYGTSITDANRQLGNYMGQVLKGTKPADLPVQQSTKFELVINMKTAKALGLDVPVHLQQIADEVIE
jgi:ABC-type uncharacterized transport system substrate-binding protein